MFGLGTILNTLAVVAGGVIGMLFGKKLSNSLQDAVVKACGVATIFIGAGGTLSHMFVVEGNSIATQDSMLLIFSLVLGVILGELLRIEDRMEGLATRLKKALHAEKDHKFVDGFVTTSLVICVGAMAIVGSIQDGISGDYSMLAAKAVLDFAIVIVFASTYGLGATCSAIAIFVYQGLITVVAHFAGAFIGDELLGYLTFIGSALIFCVGINICFEKKFKVGNMLPSLLVPVAYVIIKGFGLF